MKNKLTALFGTFGSVLSYLASFLLSIAPLLVLDLPLWADMIILILLNAAQLVPFLGMVPVLGVYVWAFIVALRAPSELLSILFFIAFAFNLLKFMLFCKATRES